MGVNCDDCFLDKTLPFTFPFFGQNYTSVTVSSNGSLYFGGTPSSHPSHDAPGSVVTLAGFKMIAGLWLTLI